MLKKSNNMVKKRNFLYKNVNEINIFILLLLGLVLISISGFTSYAIFSSEVESSNLITGKIVTKNLDKSGANAPVLSENMIPVYFDATANAWKKADASNEDSNYKWYDYDAKMWANAVTVDESMRETYLNAAPGTVISSTYRNTDWVWVPRFKYTYFTSSSTPKSISITFEKGTAATGGIACGVAIGSDGPEICMSKNPLNTSLNGKDYTHPAFKFGDDELTGIWVGKFDNSATEVPTATSNLLRTVMIKRGADTWRYTPVAAFFQSIRLMEKAGNIYGFPQSGTTLNKSTGEITGDSNNLDTHMMKNIERGALAYLSHSKYGSATAIERNTTTYAGGGTGSTYTSKTAQSTTKNIYGVYDVSGGANEFVMANMQDESNNFYPSNAGGTWTSTSKPLEKYYDRYAYGTSGYTYNRSKVGDAIKEMDPGSNGNTSWYSAFCVIPYSVNSWFLRGGTAAGTSASGLFYSGVSTGGAGSAGGSRSVLTIIK